MLLQNSKGMFQLVVWDERVKGEDHVTVDLGQNQKSVEVYDPTVGTEPVQVHTGVKSISLKLSDHSLILAILK